MWWEGEQMGLLVYSARLSLKGAVGCQGLGWHGANPSMTTLSVPCSWLSISQPRGGLRDRGRHRPPADLLHGPLTEPEAQPRWVTSHDPSCLICPGFSEFGAFALAKKIETPLQSQLLQAGTSPCFSRLLLLSWSLSAEDGIDSDVLLEAAAGHWCILMSSTLQRLAHVFLWCCSAPCTHQLYLHHRVGTASVSGQESCPSALHRSFGRVPLPRCLFFLVEPRLLGDALFLWEWQDWEPSPPADAGRLIQALSPASLFSTQLLQLKD